MGTHSVACRPKSREVLVKTVIRFHTKGGPVRARDHVERDRLTHQARSETDEVLIAKFFADLARRCRPRVCGQFRPFGTSCRTFETQNS